MPAIAPATPAQIRARARTVEQRIARENPEAAARARHQTTATWSERLEHTRDAATWAAGSVGIAAGGTLVSPLAGAAVAVGTAGYLTYQHFANPWLLLVSPVTMPLSLAGAGVAGVAALLYTAAGTVVHSASHASWAASALGAAIVGTPGERTPEADHMEGRDTVDVENVMRTARIGDTGAAIGALQRRFGTVDTDARLAAVQAFLDELSTIDLPPHVEAAVFRVRGGAPELTNAMRTLEHVRSAAPSLTIDGVGSVTMRDLTALVTHAIDQFEERGGSPTDTLRERSNMRASLFAALAQCVEDDGHIVCAYGISQRLMSVVQGRFDEVAIDVPKVGTLVTQFCRELAREHGDVQPTDDVLEAFVGRVLVRAEELYGRGSPRVAQVKEQIGAYLDMTYGDGANDVEEEQRPPAAAA